VVHAHRHPVVNRTQWLRRTSLAIGSAIAANFVAQAQQTAPTGGGWQLTHSLITELARTQTHLFLWATLKGIAVGGIVGLVVGILCLFLANRLGLYRSAWRHERWVRWPFWILTVLLSGSFVAMAGFWQGAIRGSEIVLAESQFGTRLLPELGRLAADGLAATQVWFSDNTHSRSNLAARLEAFHAGTWELNAPELVTQLGRVKMEMIDEFLPGLEAQALARFPQLQAEPARTLLRRAGAFLTSALIDPTLNDQVRRVGADRFALALRERLVSEAARAGNPETITQQELSRFLVRDGIIPALMAPIRSFCNSQRMLCLAGFGISIFAPPLVFRLTCGRKRPAATNAP
jgi:hypothetical protein